MSARRTIAASPSASSAWWRSIAVARRFGRPQRRASTPPTSAWSTPSSRRSRWSALLGRARVAVDLARDSPDRRGVRTSLPTSCRSAEQSSSSRSSYSSSRASRSAADCVATACRRKRSGMRSQPGVRSKKSKVAVRAASVSTPSGERISTASGMLAILPFLRWAVRLRDAQHGDHERDVGLDGRDHLADRGTVLAHDPQHAVARLGERRERLERLERGGQAAAVAFVVARRGRRERPAAGCEMSGFHRSCRACVTKRYRHGSRQMLRRGFRTGRVAGARLERRVDARQRLLAPERGHRLEDPRRDRGAGDRHPHRLEDLAWLDLEPLDHAAQRLLDLLGLERLGGGLERARAPQRSRSGAPSRHHLAPRPSRRTPPGARRGSRPAARSRRASASSPG